MPELSVGTTIAGRFEISGEASHGPGGVEIRALDHDVDVEVTLWVPAPTLFADPARADELIASAATLRGLGHPHLRRVFALVQAESGPVASLQIGGREGLAARHGNGAGVDVVELCAIAAALGGALGAAHDKGVAHGWLSPFDLVEVGGALKLSGVGLYRHADLDAARTAFTSFKTYVAPETWEDGVISPASDAYGLAILLAELATGRARLPLDELVAAASERNAQLGALVARALARDPAARPADARTLAGELGSIFGAADLEPSAADRRAASVPPPGRRRPSALGLDGDDEREPLADGEDLAFNADQAPTRTELRRAPLVRPGTEAFDVQLASETGERAPTADGAGDGETIQEDAPLYMAGAMRPIAGLVAGSALDLSGLPRPARPASDADRGPDGDPDEDQPEPDASSPTTPIALAARAAHHSSPTVSLGLASLAEAVTPDHRRTLRGRRDDVPPTRQTPRPPLRQIGSPPTPWTTYAGLAAVAAVAAVVAVVLLSRGDGPSPAPPPPPPAAPAAHIELPPPAAPTGPCPAGMALVDGEKLARDADPFCIDRWEAPGPGALPARVPHFTARAMCAERQTRLCSEKEWEDACRGPGRASWPYGGSYVVGRCNLGPGTLEVAGARPACQSASTAFDMSGNAAEWSDEGIARGGAVGDGTQGRCSQRSRPREGASLGFRCCTDPLVPPLPGSGSDRAK